MWTLVHWGQNVLVKEGSNFGGKTSLGPSYLLSKNFILSYAFNALLSQHLPFSPPNCGILWIILLCNHNIWMGFFFTKEFRNDV
jgi:hypothetical protein